MYNVIVEKNEKETTPSLFRRFSKKIQTSGIVKKYRKGRDQKRIPSKLVKKNQKIRKLKRQSEFEQLLRLGKVQLSNFRNNRR